MIQTEKVFPIFSSVRDQKGGTSIGVTAIDLAVFCYRRISSARPLVISLKVDFT